MRKFILTNRIGHDLRNAIENPSFVSSEIAVFDNSGIEIERIPVTPLTLYMYSPEPDPRYQKPERIITTTGEVEIPVMIPEDTVTTGENPFIQLIHRFTKKRNGVTLEDIVRYLTKEKKVLPADEYGISRVKAMVREMYKGNVLSGLLIKQGNLYMAGVRLKTGRQLIKLYSGYDPFEYQIMQHFESKGHISREELHTLIMDRLKWARNSKTVEFYIKKLLKQENIKQIGKDWFEYKKALEPF